MSNGSEPVVLHLSPSVAANLISRNALRAWREHSRGGAEEVEPTELMRRGNLFDRLLFGGTTEIVIVDAADWRTKIAQEARAAAEAERKIAVLAHKYAETEASANAIGTLLLDRGIDVTAGKCQHRVVWSSEGVACKGFLDLLFIDDMPARIFDLKIVDDASAVKLDMRASIQAAAYPEAIETLYPALAGRVTMQFIIAEADGGDMRIAEPDGQLRALGASRWRRAVATWGECVRRNEWPGYPREVVRVEAKPWDLAQEMDATIPEGGSSEPGF
jgi:hypothetical protein